MRAKATVYHVELEHSGKTYNLDVPAGQTILDVATEKYKLDLPYGQYCMMAEVIFICFIMIHRLLVNSGVHYL